MYRCIGQSRTKSGLVQCSNESETPTWKEIYLCISCSSAPPIGRPKLDIERPEEDKPNFDEDTEFYPARAAQEEIDIEFFDHLEELDL